MNFAGVSGVASSPSVVQIRNGWYQSSGRAGAVPAMNQSVMVWPAQLGVASSPLALQTITFFSPAPCTPQTTLRLEFTFAGQPPAHVWPIHAPITTSGL